MIKGSPNINSITFSMLSLNFGKTIRQTIKPIKTTPSTISDANLHPLNHLSLSFWAVVFAFKVDDGALINALFAKSSFDRFFGGIR